MPYYRFGCRHCKAEYEHQLSVIDLEEKFNDDIEEFEEWFECNNYCCEPGDLTRLMSVPAKHSSWESTGKYGVNGTYNRGLGCVVYSDADMRAKARAKGLIPADEFSGGTWSNVVDNSINQAIKKHNEHEEAISTIKKSLDEHKDEGRAIAEAFSIDQMKETGALTAEVNKEAKSA
jgi:hypothetical protein